jgi:hypothetical protein
MSLEEDARAAALANTNITNLIGSRFYPNEAPQEAARPLVIYQQIASQGERTLSGFHAERRAQYQWRLVCDSYEQIVQLKAAVKQLSGTGHGSIAKIDIDDGPDGFDFETVRYTKVMSVYLTK